MTERNFIFFVEMEMRKQFCSDTVEELQKLISRLTVVNCFVPGILNELNQLVGSMELLADTNVEYAVLRQQSIDMTALIQQFSEKIAKLSSNDKEKHHDVIEQLTTRIETLRLSLENALERNLLWEVTNHNGKRVDKNTNWYDETKEDCNDDILQF